MHELSKCEKSSWQFYHDHLVELLINKHQIADNKSLSQADCSNFWAHIGFTYEDLFNLFQCNRDYETLGNKLWCCLNERRSKLHATISLSWAINALLTFLEYNAKMMTYPELEGHLQRCTSPTLNQLDGIDDSDIENPYIPPCLGNIDSIDEQLFHIATLFRGIDWSIFHSHDLCDYKLNVNSSKSCLLCLVRSYSVRLNDMRLLGGRKYLNLSKYIR